MDNFIKLLGNSLTDISGFLYSNILVVVLVAAGLLFTVLTKFAQFRLIKEQFRLVTEKPKDGGVSSFQALMVSTASRVGTGNIIGVSSALCLGGYGAIFWMWVIAVIGSASAFIESTLAQIYKRKGKDGSFGGPAYYIEQGLGLKWLAVIFSVILIFTYGVGFNMLASYNLQSSFSAYSFYEYTVGDVQIVPIIIGVITAVLVAICLLGGGKSIVKTTSLLVPVMGVAYVGVALIVVLLNITSLPSVFAKIFESAFDFKAIFGGFTGSCVMYGIKRGLFSNEAGVGSAPNASAAAEVTHPAKQGLVQVLSVFIDTLLICSATAFMCVCSGVEPSKSLEGAPYVQAALEKSFGAFGPIFITVAMALFAFTTLLGNLFYVDKCFDHIFGHTPSKLFMICYRLIASLLVAVGALLNAGMLWDIADIAMGLMTLINIPVIIILSRWALRALKDYTRQRKEGKDPVFLAQDINLPHKVDYWN